MDFSLKMFTWLFTLKYAGKEMLNAIQLIPDVASNYFWNVWRMNRAYLKGW